MWKRCCATLAAMLLAVCALAQGGPLIVLDPSTDEQPLPGRMEWLEDESARMSLDQVRSATGWSVLSTMPSMGYTRSAIWLRLRLEQPANGINWILSIDDSQIDWVELHTPMPEGGWGVQRTGRSVDRRDWAYESRTPAFRLRLPPGQHEVYLRLQSLHLITHTIRLQTGEGYQLRGAQDGLLYGTFFGICMAALLLQVFFWLATREALGFWYLVYSLMILTVTSLTTGYPQLLLGDHQPTPLLLGILITLAPLAVVRLTAVWLELHRHAPRLNLLFQGSAYVTALMGTLFLLLGHYTRAMQLGQGMNLLWMLLSLAIAAWLWRRRVVEARIYLLVFGVIVFWIMVRYMRNLGLLPVNPITDYALFIGAILQLLMMSLYFIQRYNTLQASLASEQRAREEQKDFVGMVSHEFRTPLAIINTSIQQLAANLDAPAERSLQRAQNIRNAVQRMDLLLDDYLSLDRLDSAQQALRPRTCDFYEVIEDAASDWPLGRVRIVLDKLPPRFVCDPDLIRIVLRNLLANAVRHSPDSSVIELNVTGQGEGSLCIRVQDQGEGIPAEELPRLFQRYFRGRASQGKPGAGLGLHLVQRIVQLHGGTIEVQSTVGQGTTFTIVLPPGQLPRN